MLIDKIKLLWNMIVGKAKLASRKDTAVVCVGMQTSAKYGVCPGAQVDSDTMAGRLSNYGSVTLLQNRNATTAAVAQALRGALEKDLCIFYYSGHGGQQKDPKGQGGISEFLCLNNGPLHDYEIWNMISGAKGRVVLIFDCCHSATMFREIGDDGVDTEFMNLGFGFKMLWNAAASREDGTAEAAKSHGILVWAGCPANSYSYGDNNGGVLTNGIKKGLKSGATYDSVWETAKKAAKSQMPVRTVIGSGFDGLVFR